MTPTNTITEEMLVAHPEYTLAGLTIGDVVPEEGKIIGEEDFTVTQEFLDLNPEAVEKIGDVIKRPILAPKVEVAPAPETPEEPKTPETTETTEEVATPEVAEETVVDDTPKKYFEGKLIISESPWTNEGHEYIMIRTEDGVSSPVIVSDYEDKVVTVTA